MTVPFNNGKIKMGINYQPTRYVETDPDMLLLQTHLIQDPALIRKKYLVKRAYWALWVFIALVVWLHN